MYQFFFTSFKFYHKNKIIFSLFDVFKKMNKNEILIENDNFFCSAG